MKPSIRIQLMIMMFLQFFMWGAWYGQMSKYLLSPEIKATGVQVGWAYTAFSIANIIAPFFVGMVADRFFAAQKLMGILNLVGAVILFFLTQIKDGGTFFWYILAYTLTFAPTLALSTAVAMRQMTSPEKEFPAIRVLGTISWIVVTNIVGYLAVGDKVTIFQISMVTAVVLGIYCFFLPDTPPKAKGQKTTFAQIIGSDAFVLFKDRSFLIFFISSVLICIPLSFYYNLANPSLTDSHMTNVENKMSLGQASEVFFMLMLPIFFRKLGVKNLLILGLVAWIVRFLCFGYGDARTSEWLLYLGIVLHGMCYDFFFVTGQIYTDNKAGEKIQASAQGLITLATYGVGMGIGSWLSGVVLDMYKTGEAAGKATYNWTSVWLVPAGIAVVVLILFVLLFSEKRAVAAKAELA